MREEQISVTLSPLLETLAPMVRKVDVKKFYNPSWLDIWAFLLLAILCSMPRGLQHNCKVKGKQPNESLIGQCEQKITQGFLLVSLLWYQKFVFDKSPILSYSLYLGIFFISIHQQWMLFWLGIGHTLIKFKGKIELVHEIDLASDHVSYTNRLLVTNQESPELSLYPFKRVCRTTFQKTWGKLPNLLGMKLTTDITWLFLSSVNTDVFAYFLCYRCGL